MLVSNSGLHAGILSAMKPSSSTSAMSKSKMTKYLFWCEKSLRERKHRDRGAAVSQMEKMVVVTPEEPIFSHHARASYPGSNRGDVIGPVQAPDWDEPPLSI